MAGFLYGDGTCYRSKNGAYSVWVDQTSKREELLKSEVIPRLRREGFKIYVYQYKDRRHGTKKTRVLVYSKKLFEDFRKIRAKPTEYLETLDRKDVKLFIAGLFDAEGTITDRIVIYNSNLKLLRKISEYLINLGIESKIYKFGSVYGLQIHKKCSMDAFFKEIPSRRLMAHPPG